MPPPTGRRSVARRAFAMLLACASAAMLAACQHAPPPPSNATPGKAVATNLRLTALGDLDGLMRNRLPPADYVRWRSEWDESHAHPVPVSVEQQEQFAKIMRMLTEPGAEANLEKRLAPTLAPLRGGKNAPAPIFGSILEAAGKQMIAESPQLGPAQRELAAHALDALTAWARTTDFSNRGKARKAIDLICATARELNVRTIQQWRALDYATTMKDYGILWNGLEGVLRIYGLDLAGSLVNADIRTVSNDGGHAVVRLDMTLAGRPIAGQWPMVRQDGHWYDAAMLAAWRKSHPASASGVAKPESTAGPASGATIGPGSGAAPSTVPTKPSSAPAPAGTRMQRP